MSAKGIFVSSVMRDFTNCRQAARDGINLLRMRPIMAEDFGAKPHSPQQACLDGVRESDVVVLILGRRYGCLTQSRKSATEEEFNHARERGIPVLVFLQVGDLEGPQAEFVERLKNYEEGYNIAFFKRPGELKDKVVQSLYDLFGKGGRPYLDKASAVEHFDRCKWGGDECRRNTPWIGAVLLPARQQRYISHLTLGERGFQDVVLREAMFGPARIFSAELGVSRSEKEDSIVFRQLANRVPTVSLEVNSSGCLVFGGLLGPKSQQVYSIVRNTVIDENDFQSRLIAFFRYAHQFYALLDANRMLTSFYFGGSLSGIEQKLFGRIPDPEPTSISMGSHGFSDFLRFPREPFELSRADLANGTRSAVEITSLLSRMFRAANAYYTPTHARS